MVLDPASIIVPSQISRIICGIVWYNKDRTDWFFCEVKGKGDRFKSGQIKYFESIELLSGREIFLIKIDKKSAVSFKLSGILTYLSDNEYFIKSVTDAVTH